MTTIRQVSKAAGVSVATVSRVINGNERVAAATREAVVDAMKKLGYQPNLTAQSLATRKSNILGLVVAELAGPFFGDMMYNLESHMKANGRHLIITSSHGELQDERDAIDFLLKRQCDALILHLDAMPDDEIVSLIRSSKTPIILINRYIDEVSEHCIYLDNFKGGVLAAEHLIEAGCRNLAVVTGPLHKKDASDRLAGFLHHCKSKSVDVPTQHIIESNFNELGGVESAQIITDSGLPVDGIFCGNDLMAYGVISELNRQNLSVPGDISVVGYDDIVMSRYISPGLSTIRVPIAQMGREAGELVLRFIEQDDRQVQRKFEPVLVQRGTVTQ